MMPAGSSFSLFCCGKERLGKGGGLDGHDQFISEHVAPACGNLCRALGEDFAMFLPVVLPPLLAALEAEVKFSMEAVDPDDDGEVRLSQSQFISLLLRRCCIHAQMRFEALFASCARAADDHPHVSLLYSKYFETGLCYG